MNFVIIPIAGVLAIIALFVSKALPDNQKHEKLIKALIIVFYIIIVAIIYWILPAPQSY